MSDQVILAIIGSIVTMMSLHMTYRLAKLKTVVDSTHKAVNSVSLILARRLAEATATLVELRGTPTDIANAEDASKALAQSEEVQDGLIGRNP